MYVVAFFGERPGPLEGTARADHVASLAVQLAVHDLRHEASSVPSAS